MGQTSSQAAEISVDEDFDYAKYIQSGVTEKEVKIIRASFEQLEPENGLVEVSRLFQAFSASKDSEKIKNKLRGKATIDFDTYYQITSEILRDKKFNMENVEIDTQVRDSSYVCCQTVYKKQK